MPRANLQDFAVLTEHNFRVERCDSTGAQGYTLTHDGCGNGPAYLMIGVHGCVSPTQWEAVAEGLKRIAEDGL